MKKFAFVIFAILCVTSCVKEDSPITLSNDDSVKNTDFIKKVHSDYITGKLTITYESGKRAVKDFPKDTLTARQILLRNQSARTPNASVHILGQDYIEFDEPMIDYEDESAAAGIPINVKIGCSVARDPNTGFIMAIMGFYGAVVPPIVEYIAANGELATRNASVMGLTGYAGPLPGSPVVASWHYFVNVVYTWSNGYVFTRQYERTGTKMLY